MAVKWRARYRICVLFTVINIIYGYEEMYTISQLSPKSAHNDRLPQNVLKTEVENLAFRIESSVKQEDLEVDREEISVEPSRNTRSININEIPLTNNEIDYEVHNKRKYYDITPTKTIDYKDDEVMMLSDGFGDKLDFKFPGEGKRAPKGRALAPTEPRMRATVQPTLTLREGRQKTEIQNIITGLVKLLNGNVNVQANSQLLNGRPRPMASRINNRGPPRISDIPPIEEYETVTHSFVPTKTPPPYPFDRPPELPPRPFNRPIPWRRPRPPPNRRPNPALPIYLPPPIENIPSELEYSGNKIHEPETVNITEIDITTELTLTTEKQMQTTEKVTEATLKLTTEITTEKVKIEKPKDVDKKESTDKKEPNLKKEVTDKKDAMDKTKDTVTKNNVTDKETTNNKYVTNKKESTDKKEVAYNKESNVINKESNKNATDKKEAVNKKDVTNKESTENKDLIEIKDKIIKDSDFDIIQPSISEVSVTSTSATPTEVLNGATLSVATTDKVIEKTSINTHPIPTTNGVPYHPYRPRPGIVLDDTDFKPHGTRFRQDAPVITAPEHLPGYGEIFDVTVSAIQGPGEKGGSVHIENINIHNDDIIVSPSGEQGFVSIDGKRTYLNLFDTTTSISATKVQTATQTVAPQTTTVPLGTGVAVPADDVPAPPIRRPHRPQTYRRPQPTVRIDTCIVGDDSTCDQAQNEKCRTEAGISSCQCRPGFARRIHRDPCRRVVSLLLELRVDRLYDRKVVWDSKLADKDSEPYQQLSFEAVRAIDSAFSMTPFSDDFVSGSVNSIYNNEESQVYVNYTILMQETPETLRSAVAADIQKHLLGVIRRRSNNVGTSALWVDSPAGSVLPLRDVDECSSPDLNDCHKLAICSNTWGAFKCTCPDTTLDPSVGVKAGRECRECSTSHCNERGVCKYSNGQPSCSCSSGYYGSSCEVDGEVVGVAVGASLAAALVIALTLAALTAWSRKWTREQKAMGMGSPVFNYMAANTVKTPPVGQPPYQVTLEERMRWAQLAEAMAQANHYAQPEPAQMVTRPSSAMFGYPTLPPVPLPRMGLHGQHTGTMNTVNSRQISASHHNLYGYTNHMASESTSSDASSHVQDRADLLVPRPKSRSRSMHNQTGIYYDVEYENAPEPIYGSKGIPLSTYTVSRGPPFYR